MDPLSVAGSIAGLVSLVETFIQLTSAYVTDVKGCPTDIKNMAQEVQSLGGVLLTLERVIHRLPNDRVTPVPEADGSHTCRLRSTNTTGLAVASKCLDDCQQILKELTEELQKSNPSMTRGLKKAAKTLVWPFKKGDIENRVVRLGRYKQDFQLALAALNM
jgi:hypothetical protein